MNRLDELLELRKKSCKAQYALGEELGKIEAEAAKLISARLKEEKILCDYPWEYEGGTCLKNNERHLPRLAKALAFLYDYHASVELTPTIRLFLSDGDIGLSGKGDDSLLEFVRDWSIPIKIEELRRAAERAKKDAEHKADALKKAEEMVNGKAQQITRRTW